MVQPKRPFGGLSYNMFSKRFKLKIAVPCTESWEGMQSSVSGRFCDSCAKNVVDFTPMSEAQLFSYFKNKPKNVCGRFEKSQLDHIHSVKPELVLPYKNVFFST